MNWGALFVTLPIQMLIIYGIIMDIKEIIKRKEKQQIREANLLRDTIYVDVSNEDLYMLDVNVKRYGCLSRSEYLRKIIRELNKDA